MANCVSFGVCVRYCKKSLAWKIVKVFKQNYLGLSQRVFFDRANWWVVIPSYDTFRGGQWCNPRKILKTYFTETRFVIELNLCDD